MSLTSAFNAPVVKIVGDKEYTFPKLSPPEMAELAARIKARRVDEAKRLADACGLSGMDKYKVVKEAHDLAEGEVLVWQHASTPAGAVEVIRVSLKRTGTSDADIKAIIDDLDSGISIVTALEVTCCPKDEEKPKQDQKPDAKPQEQIEKKDQEVPATYGR